MPRLDPLLRELAKHDEATLLLEPGSRPRLSGAGREREVSRTVLGPALVTALLRELAPGESAATIGSRPAAFSYRLDDHSFEVEVEPRNGAPEAKIRRSPPVAEAVPATSATLPSQPSQPERPRPTPSEPLGDSSGPTAPQPQGESPEPTPTGPSAEGPEPTPSPSAPLPEIATLLGQLLERQGSDLHLSSGQRPRMRIHGELLELEQYRSPTNEELRERLWQVTQKRNRDQLEERHDTDFALELPGQARFRVNLFMDRSGIGAVFRLIPYEIPTFEELDLPEVLRKLGHLSKGLVLVTGPTGSGKSTTLAAIVDLINQTRPDHIITIEDPIEFVHRSKKSLINQREVGIHTRSFGQALRAALREDPDVILVGEMRDLETIAIAIETAETGHLVFGTLHTTTAPSTVERVVDQFPGDRQGQIRMMLAESLRAIISQTLLRRIAGGRVAAFEILICTPAVSNLIREGKTFQIASAMQTGRGLGMLTLTDSLHWLVKEKIVRPEEAYLKAVDKEALVRKLQADGISVKLDKAPAEDS